VQQLAEQFVVVADEVYMLYPEDAGNLARVASDPAHLLFKAFGESMPRGAWNHPGTKQGIYMMGPQGEYLEGIGAASGDPRDVVRRLERALAAWEDLRKAKKYANRPVPSIPEQAPPEVVGKPLILRASLRDLPRRAGDEPPARWRRGAFDDGNWATFPQWAWNQNWIAFDDAATFVTDGKEPVAVAPEIVRRLCREVLVDNVRGQAPFWDDAHVQHAALTVRRLRGGARWQLEFVGEVRMVDGPRGFAARLFGEAEWDPASERFVRFDLLALGDRRGGSQFNQRAADPGPAPMGVALRLFAPAANPPRRR
jgi:hypothetical protein